MTPRSDTAQRARCGMTHAEIRDAATDTHKHCSQCGGLKVLEDFPAQSRGFKGRMAWCNDCWLPYRAEHARRPASRERRNEYLRSDDGHRKMRIARMRALFGERGAELEARRLDGAPCQVCGGSDVVCLDHDHELHEARGLLCRRCNLLLHAGVTPELLRRLADYAEGGDANEYDGKAAAASPERSG